MPEETPIWNGSPSQIVNLPGYLLCILFFWLVVPLFVMLWQWLVLRNTRYELTSERLKLRHGVLNKEMNDLELYRVRDYKFEQPFFLRIFGLGNITLQTSDSTTPVLVIRAIRDGERLRDMIRNAVEACRVKKGVREVDLQA
jgi:uncharacterized membrane protein YdbT with pleckstrin-like domain